MNYILPFKILKRTKIKVLLFLMIYSIIPITQVFDHLTEACGYFIFAAALSFYGYEVINHTKQLSQK